MSLTSRFSVLTNFNNDNDEDDLDANNCLDMSRHDTVYVDASPKSTEPMNVRPNVACAKNVPPKALASTYSAVLPKVLTNVSGLKLAHLNVRSLKSIRNNTIDQVRSLLEGQSIDVFAVSETWLNSEVSDAEVSIDGYTLYRKDRGSRGGGVAIYIKSSISHNLCVELTNDSDIEAVWLLVKLAHRKPFKVCCVYRPPSAGEDYFEHMLLNFEAAMADHEVVIMGDLNYNYVLDDTLASNPAHFLELLLNCSQLIHEPTRVTYSSATTIDLVYTSMPDCHTSSGVVECTISDHYMTYTVLQHPSKERAAPKYVTLRDYKHFNVVNYCNDLMDSNLYYSINNKENMEDVWQCWSTCVLKVMNKHAPLRTYRVRDRSNPWMTRDIIDMMYKRDHALKRSRETGSPQFYNEYKLLRNTIVNEIRMAKKRHYTEKILKSKGSKEMWKTIRSLLNSKKANSSTSTGADDFNDYFSGIGTTLNSTFPESTSLSWSRPDCIYKFKFDSIPEENIFKYLSTLSDCSNNDVLGFDSKLLRYGAEVLTTSLTDLFNMSINSHQLPADWKRARVTPIYKGAGSTDDPGNFRPISIVSHIPKALEKCINKQLAAFFDEHNLLTGDQSAFRGGRSTATAALKLFDDLLDNINDGMINALCFFDLKKCFDTIDHNLLFLKLERYGILDNELLWFKDYLSGRSQTVAINGCMSEFKEILTGVPQGSVLGPFLFLIFINDLPDCLHRTASNMYADDTEIHASGETITEVNSILQQDVDNIAMWFYNNKLVVNSSKSYCMLVSSNRNVVSDALDIYVHGAKIEQVQSIRYLGLHPDSMLSWSVHIMKLCNKIAPKVGLLRRLKHIVPVECLKNIYQTTVQCHIDYCITIWGFTSSAYLDKVQRLQNRAARIITGKYDRFNIRGINLVKELGWLNLRQRRDYFTAIFVFQALHGTSPDHMVDLFTYSGDINLYNTRSSSSDLLYLPKANKHLFTKSLQFNGPRVWNSLTQTIRSSSSLGVFKANLKEFYLQ